VWIERHLPPFTTTQGKAMTPRSTLAPLGAILFMIWGPNARAGQVCYTGAELLADASVSFPSRAPALSGSSLTFAPGSGQGTLVSIPLFAAGELLSDGYATIDATITRTRLQADDDLNVVVTDGAAAGGVAAQDNFGGILIAYQLDHSSYPFYDFGPEVFLTSTSGVGAALPAVGGATAYDMSVGLDCDGMTLGGTWGTESGQHAFSFPYDRTAGLSLDVVSEAGDEAYQIDQICLDVTTANYAGACAVCTGGDCDGDGVHDGSDNCPDTANGDQADTDADLQGDVCDSCPADVGNDADQDGLCESDDNCPAIANASQIDSDGDGAGDACDSDDDDDGVADGGDNCPYDANADQADADGDGAGDACDSDVDGDGVIDVDDQCLGTALDAAVDDSGCSIAELCPCEHPAGGDRWKNHGAYVSCVAHAGEDFVDAGLISEADKGDLQSDAGASTCGHKNK